MSAGVLSHQFSRQITVLWKRRKKRSYLLYSIKQIHINHHRLLLWHLSFPSQSCTVRTLVTWSTPPGLYLTLNSWWGRPFSIAAILASSCRGAPPSLATAGSRGPPCGRLDYLTVFVSVGKTRESFSGRLAWVICFFPAIIAPECQRRRFMCCISFLWLMIYVHPCVHWCVWYVNAMLMRHTNQPSATWRRGWRLSMSHVTSVGARQICQPARLWRKSSDLLWETQQDPVFPFFFFLSAEDSVSCENPGLPDNGYQILSKRLYLPGESLTFVCYQGYELIGEAAIKCILGNPSFWSGPLPLCRGKMFTDLCKSSV